jgi:hypothetical protein
MSLVLLVEDSLVTYMTETLYNSTEKNSLHNQSLYTVTVICLKYLMVCWHKLLQQFHLCQTLNHTILCRNILVDSYSEHTA